MAVTLKQLAQELGLHHSTVAYALSGKGTVKQATRDRVRELAAQAGYIVNGLARRMRSKRTNTIGLVIPDVVMSCSEFTQQVFHDVLGRGYDSQVVLTEGSRELEDKAVRQLLECRVDGIILHSVFDRWEDVPEQHAVRQIAVQAIPTVCYGYPIHGAPFPCVQHPVLRQAEMLTEHLIVQGHTHFAWLMPEGGSRDRASEYELTGSRRALTAAGIRPSNVRVVSMQETHADHPATGDGNSSLSRVLPRTAVQRGRQLLRQAWAMLPRPTALLCGSDVTAIGAMIEAQEMGLRIGKDVAIAATSRTIAAELAPIPLTTADVSPGEGVRLVLDLLLDTIDRHSRGENAAGSNRKHTAQSVSPQPELIVGRSTQA